MNVETAEQIAEELVAQQSRAIVAERDALGVADLNREHIERALADLPEPEVWTVAASVDRGTVLAITGENLVRIRLTLPPDADQLPALRMQTFPLGMRDAFVQLDYEPGSPPMHRRLWRFHFPSAPDSPVQVTGPWRKPSDALSVQEDFARKLAGKIGVAVAGPAADQ